MLKVFIKLLNVLQIKWFAAALCQNVQIANMCKVYESDFWYEKQFAAALLPKYANRQDVQSSQMVVKAKTSLLKGLIKLLNVLQQKRFAAAFCQNVQIALPRCAKFTNGC